MSNDSTTVEATKSQTLEPSVGFTGAVQASARKINSPTLRSYLLNQYKDDLQYSHFPATELARRYAELMKSIGGSETAERSLLVKIKDGATPALGVLELWCHEARDGRSTLGSIEDWFSSLGEDMRLAQTNPIEQIRAQIALGVITGVYRGVKGIVLSIPEMLELGWKLVTDDKTQAAAWDLYRRYLIWSLKLHLGTPSMRMEAARELAQTLDSIWNLVSQYVTEKWEQAREEGRETELVATWLTQGVFEIATAALAFTKGAKAVKAARAGAEAASLAGKASTLEKAAEIESAVAKAASATKQAQAAEQLKKSRYIAKFISHGEVLEVIGQEAAKLVRQASRRVQRKVLRDLSEFIPSATNRLGKTIPGRQVFLENPLMRERILKKMIATLTKIEKGEPVDVFMIIKKGTKEDPAKYVREATKKGAKGPSFKSFMEANDANNRLGKGRYVSVGEYHTARFEVFADGNVQDGYAILKAKFQPRNGLQHDFRIVPSVRQPGAGVNIVDKDLLDWSAFKDMEILWDGKIHKLK